MIGVLAFVFFAIGALKPFHFARAAPPLDFHVARDCRRRSERTRHSFTASFAPVPIHAVALALRSSAARSMKAAHGPACHGGSHARPSGSLRSVAHGAAIYARARRRRCLNS